MSIFSLPAIRTALQNLSSVLLSSSSVSETARPQIEPATILMESRGVPWGLAGAFLAMAASRKSGFWQSVKTWTRGRGTNPTYIAGALRMTNHRLQTVSASVQRPEHLPRTSEFQQGKIREVSFHEGPVIREGCRVFLQGHFRDGPETQEIIDFSIVDAMRLGLIHLAPIRQIKRNILVETLYFWDGSQTNFRLDDPEQQDDRHLPVAKVLGKGIFAENQYGKKVALFPVLGTARVFPSKGVHYRLLRAQAMTEPNPPRRPSLQLIVLDEDDPSHLMILSVGMVEAIFIRWVQVESDANFKVTIDHPMFWVVEFYPSSLGNRPEQIELNPKSIFPTQDTVKVVYSGEVYGEMMPNGYVLLSKVPMDIHLTLQDMEILSQNVFSSFGLSMDDLKTLDSAGTPLATDINWNAVKMAARGAVRIVDPRQPDRPLWVILQKRNDTLRKKLNTEGITGARLKIESVHVPVARPEERVSVRFKELVTDDDPPFFSEVDGELQMDAASAIKAELIAPLSQAHHLDLLFVVRERQ